MATRLIGDVELDERELAQMGKSAYELLKPTTRLHDVPQFATTRPELEAVNQDFANMAEGIIAAYLARATTLKDAKEAQRREDAMTDDTEKTEVIEIPATEEEGPVVTPVEVEEEEVEETAEEEEAAEETK